MWFDELMDDAKQALETAVKNKGIFIPILAGTLVYALAFGIVFAAMITFIIIRLGSLKFHLEDYGFAYGMIPGIVVGILGVYLLFTVLGVMMEVGSVNLYKMVVDGFCARASYFFEGIKKYFFKAFGFTLLVHFVGLILLVPVVALCLLYSLTIGIMTAGWGVTILFVITGVYFGSWSIALVADDMDPFKALGASLKFGNNNFGKLFILVLAASQISQYLFSAFGPLISIAAGWFISGTVAVYFRLVTMTIYRKSRIEADTLTVIGAE